MYDQAQTVTPLAARLPARAVLAPAALLLVAALASGCQKPAAAKEPGAAAASGGGVTAAEVVSLGDLKKALKGHRGRIVVLHLWASWCMPCLEELPHLARFAREMRARGVDVVSFSLDTVASGTAEKVAKVIGERAEGLLDRRIVRVDDPDAFINAIDPKWEGTIPALFVFDRGGALKRSLIGESSRSELDRAVAGVLASSAK